MSPSALAGLVHTTLPATPSSVLLPAPPAAALATLLAALAIAAALSGGHGPLTWDEPIQRGVEARRTSGLNEFFLTVSRFGSTIPVLAIGTIAAAVTWRRCRAVGMAVLVATFSRLCSSSWSRPWSTATARLRAPAGRQRASFPSGHVMAAVALGADALVVSLYTRRKVFIWSPCPSPLPPPRR